MQRRPTSSSLTLRAGWSLQHNGETLLGEELVLLLRSVERERTLTAAARNAGMSYRKAWDLMGKAQGMLGAPVVEMSRGRGSRLTPLGEAITRLDRLLLDAVADQLERSPEPLAALARQLPVEREGPLRFHFSHDPFLAQAHERLPQPLRDASALVLDGSINALAGLARGDCDMAGFHGPVGSAGRAAADELRARLLAGGLRAQPLLRRVQGLMYRPGAVSPLRGLTDLCLPGRRFVNRQSGSGTRLLFDALLEEAGIHASRINGYRREEYTHAAVASQVAARGADVGFGTRSAARQYGLAFLPVCEEVYAVAWRRHLEGDPTRRALVEHIQNQLAHCAGTLSGSGCEALDSPAMPAAEFTDQFLAGGATRETGST